MVGDKCPSYEFKSRYRGHPCSLHRCAYSPILAFMQAMAKLSVDQVGMLTELKLNPTTRPGCSTATAGSDEVTVEA
jgi:hypothetical protein